MAKYSLNLHVYNHPKLYFIPTTSTSKTVNSDPHINLNLASSNIFTLLNVPLDFSVNMKIEKFDCHKFSEAILLKSILFAYVMNGIIEFGTFRRTARVLKGLYVIP